MEFVDGQLVERNVGDRLHARLQAILAALLGYRIPDVCVKAVPYEPIPHAPRPHGPTASPY